VLDRAYRDRSLSTVDFSVSQKHDLADTVSSFNAEHRKSLTAQYMDKRGMRTVPGSNSQVLTKKQSNPSPYTVRKSKLEQADFTSEADTNARGLEQLGRITRGRVGTRSRRRSSEPPIPLTSRFKQACGSREPWTTPLVYPPTGRNRAFVEWSDLARLDDDEYLNDNIISFCLLHMQHDDHGQRLADKVYYFNTFFYSALTRVSKRGIDFDAVKSWTKKLDIFNYDYLVIPINEE
jgi:Ulp1 family protease